MSTGAQTQAIPRVQTSDVGATSEVAPPEPVEDTLEESVQHLYDAGLAKLHSLHDRWTAALAELRESQASNGSVEAAA